jgi:hypothetical protein
MIEVPQALLKDPRLPSAALRTWLLVRSLAPGANCTPPVALRSLASDWQRGLSTLYGHLSLLRSLGLLDWRSAGEGILVFEFPDPLDSSLPDSGKAQPLSPPPAINSLPVAVDSRAAGENSAKPESDPAILYRAATGQRLTQAQCAYLRQQVRDAPRWRETLAHWSMHGWNPRNLPGMVDLYQRGGPEYCRFCVSAPRQANGARAPNAAQAGSLEAIRALRQEARRGRS